MFGTPVRRSSPARSPCRASPATSPASAGAVPGLSKLRLPQGGPATPAKQLRLPKPKDVTQVSPAKRLGLLLKRAHSGPAEPAAKRPRRASQEAASAPGRVQRATAPVGQPWPTRELRAFDAPFDLSWGEMLKDVMEARGWRFSTAPCHGTNDKDKPTLHLKEFEACLRGQTPDEAFGRKAAVEDGYRLQAISLPKHALWMMGRMPFRVPGTAGERVCYRDDFVKAVVDNAARLQEHGKPGNYRICKFPGTETALFKTNLTDAFRNKAWYPTTYILPKEKDTLLQEMRSGGEARSNYWIAKPRNDYGGTGIRVWRGTDLELTKLVVESDSQPRSVVQRYLADPYLLGGCKFHMRIHLMVTSLDPLEAFVQENGQCLFATKPYTLSSKNIGANFDPPVHVSNLGLNATAANKENFMREKPVIGRGQQIRMKQLEAHLTENHPAFDRRALWNQILEIAADTTRYIASAPAVRRYGKLAPDQHFEIFGMDLMLDKCLKVFMCEVNTDPGLSYPDKEILGSPNPDYGKETRACSQTLHDMFALLGLDAGRQQPAGSLRNWYKLEF